MDEKTACFYAKFGLFLYISMILAGFRLYEFIFGVLKITFSSWSIVRTENVLSHIMFTINILSQLNDRVAVDSFLLPMQ
jgi:hypothetical protein